MKKSFFVRAHWDGEAGVFYSESDIIGLHIEASTIEAFEKTMHDSAVELIIANHVTPKMMATTPLQDLIPSIFWNRPDPELACA